jgi:hypothetical protein
MPIYPLDTKEYWENQYYGGAEGPWGHPSSRQEVHLYYHKSLVLPIDRQRAQAIANAFGWDINTRLCVYQCGFGWILQGFWENGIQLIQGIENSAFIQNNLTINEDSDIQTEIELVGLSIVTGDGEFLFNALRDDGNPRSMQPTRIRDVDVTSNQEMNQLRQILGGAGAEVLTYGEYPLNRLTDQEAIDLSDNLGKLQPNRIIHLINPSWAEAELPGGGTVQLNAKTGEEWKVILPNDTFIEEGTYRIVE